MTSTTWPGTGVVTSTHCKGFFETWFTFKVPTYFISFRFSAIICVCLPVFQCKIGLWEVKNMKLMFSYKAKIKWFEHLPRISENFTKNNFLKALSTFFVSPRFTVSSQNFWNFVWWITDIFAKMILLHFPQKIFPEFFLSISEFFRELSHQLTSVDDYAKNTPKSLYFSYRQSNQSLSSLLPDCNLWNILGVLSGKCFWKFMLIVNWWKTLLKCDILLVFSERFQKFTDNFFNLT